MEITLQHCEQLEAEKESFADFSDLRIRKLNRTLRGLTGNVNANVELGNDYLLSATGYIKQGGEYRKLPYKMPEKRFCEIIEQYNNYYEEIAADSNLPVPFSCPLPEVFEFTFSSNIKISWF